MRIRAVGAHQPLLILCTYGHSEHADSWLHTRQYHYKGSTAAAFGDGFAESAQACAIEPAKQVTFGCPRSITAVMACNHELCLLQ